MSYQSTKVRNETPILFYQCPHNIEPRFFFNADVSNIHYQNIMALIALDKKRNEDNAIHDSVIAQFFAGEGNLEFHLPALHDDANETVTVPITSTEKNEI